MASKTKLTKADYIKTGLRAYYIQNGFNYGNYQGLGYANMLFPALKKMYKGNDDALQAALQDNIEFYNTNLHFVPFITSLHLAMLENDADPADIRQIKMALMGPLAGVGDSLSQFILAPLLGTIGASLAFEGQMAGVWVYLLGMNITLFIIKYLSALLGYNVLYFELPLPNGQVGQLLDVMDYISNSFLMPLISLLTCLLIGWIVKPSWIAEEMELGGCRFGRKKLYGIMIRYIAPIIMAVLFVQSMGLLS